MSDLEIIGLVTSTILSGIIILYQLINDDSLFWCMVKCYKKNRKKAFREKWFDYHEKEMLDNAKILHRAASDLKRKDLVSIQIDLSNLKHEIELLKNKPKTIAFKKTKKRTKKK